MNNLDPIITMVTTMIVVTSYGASVSVWLAFFRSRCERSDDANFVGIFAGTIAWFFFGLIVLIGGNNEWWRSLMLLTLCLLAVPCLTLGRCLAQCLLALCIALGRCIAQEVASLFTCSATPAPHHAKTNRTPRDYNDTYIEMTDERYWSPPNDI